jgi:hypothetical protein
VGARASRPPSETGIARICSNTAHAARDGYPAFERAAIHRLRSCAEPRGPTFDGELQLQLHLPTRCDLTDPSPGPRAKHKVFQIFPSEFSRPVRGPFPHTRKAPPHLLGRFVPMPALKSRMGTPAGNSTANASPGSVSFATTLVAANRSHSNASPRISVRIVPLDG